MHSDRPYYLLLPLILCLVIRNVVNAEVELTDLIALEASIAPTVHESKNGVDENEMGKLIQPTSASSMTTAEAQVTATDATSDHHGKPTMTVTAIRLGTSRYFHPGSFDEVKDEHPHSVIFPLTAESSEKPNGEKKIGTNGFTFEMSEVPPTLPSLDYDHDFLTLPPFEYVPDTSTDPANSDPLSFLSALTGGGGSTEVLNSPIVKSEELKGLSSTEMAELSAELNRGLSEEKIGKESKEREQHSSSDLPLPLSTISPSATTVALDIWPTSSMNRTDDQNSLEMPVTQTPANGTIIFDKRSKDDDFLDRLEDELSSYYEEGNDLPEVLPSPVALIDRGRNDAQLQDEFGEALRRVEPRPRQRRPGPGTKRRVRMRVRKLTRSKSDNGKMIAQASNSFGAVSGNYTTEETNTRAPMMRTRFRSTTTTPIPDPSPPTLPSTKYEPSANSPKTRSVTMKGPSPIILKTGNLRNEVLEEDRLMDSPSPQIEKPNNIGFTEKANTFFYPSSKPDKVESEQGKSLNDSAAGEWLQSANSKQHDVHHHPPPEEENYFQDRDNWEKNYMNLQQNSFYGATPEAIEHQHQGQGHGSHGQTLVDINRANSMESSRSMSGGGKDLDDHLDLGSRSAPTSSVMHSMSINIPPNQHDTTVTFNPPKIVFVDSRPVVNSQPINTETPELAIIQRPPESTQAQGSEDTHRQYISHLERPLIQFHSSEETYSALDHPDLSGPTGPTSSSEPQFPQTHYDRTKYDYVEQVHFEPGDEATTPKPSMPSVILSGNPATGEIAYNGINLANENQVHVLQNPLPTQSQVAHYPPQQNPRPFSSDEFLGFGNDKHLVPEHIPPPANRLQKTTDFEKSNSKRNGHGLQKEAIFDSPTQMGTNDQPESFGYSSDPYDKYNPFIPKSPNDPTSTNQGAPFVPFGGPPSPNTLGERQLPPPQRGERQLSSFPDPTDPNYSNQYSNRGATNRGRPTDSYKSDFTHNYPFYPQPQKQRPDGVSPTITLPMPGLVSVPTPPPASKAMHEVTPNRHFPPHTHSMAARPDYEPANPPLPNGHPLQQHFDPFVQNAGEFHEPKDHHQQQQQQQQHSHSHPQGDNLNSNFKNFNNPTQGSFSGQGSPNYAYPQSQQQSNQNQGRPSQYDMSEFDTQSYSKKRPSSTSDFKPSTYLSDIMDKGKFDPTQASLFDPTNQEDEHDEHDDTGPSGGDDYKSSSGGSPNDFPVSNYLDNEGESQESPKQDGKNKPTGSGGQGGQSGSEGGPYSKNPYVLMFANPGAETGGFPLSAKLNPTPTTSAVVDPAALGSEMQNLLGMVPGYHAVPVHPRDQMLQVLAAKHYQNMMEEYLEKRKRPQNSIYTPYGVLIPVGPTAATSASNIASEQHHGHKETPAHHHSWVPAHGHGHGHEQPGFTFSLKSPILSTHNHFHKEKGRLVGNFGLKATVEPALELLAEKVALKLSALEHLLKHPPKHESHAHAHPPPKHGYGEESVHHAANTHGSYSEQKPMQANPDPTKPPPKKPTSLPKPSNKSKSNRKLVAEKESSDNFKLYIKELLKERLYQMLSEIDEAPAESNVQTVQVAPDSPSFASSSQKPRGEPYPAKVVEVQKIVPVPVPIPVMHRKQPPKESGGIIQSIKNFFSFGSGNKRKRTHSREQMFEQMLMQGTHLMPKLNFSNPPHPHHHIHPNQQIDQATSSSSTRFKHKSLEKESGAGTGVGGEKLNAKDVEKILSILLKSESTETRGGGMMHRKSDNSGDDDPPGGWIPSPSNAKTSKRKKHKKFSSSSFSDPYEPSMSASMNRPMGIRMVAPSRHNPLEANRRNFVNSKIDKGHFRMPRSSLFSSDPTTTSTSTSTTTTTTTTTAPTTTATTTTTSTTPGPPPPAPSPVTKSES